MTTTADEIGTILLENLENPDDLYEVFIDWLDRHCDNETLVFYRPESSDDYPFKDSLSVQSQLLSENQIELPQNQTLKFVRTRKTGLVNPDHYLIHLTTDENWYGAIEGSGSEPLELRDNLDLISKYFEISHRFTLNRERANNSRFLTKLSEILYQSNDLTDAIESIYSLLFETTGHEKIAYYETSGDQFSLQFSKNISDDRLEELQLVNRERLLDHRLEDEPILYEPTDNSKANIYLLLKVGKTEIGLIALLDYSLEQDHLTKREKESFRNITSLAAVTMFNLQSSARDEGYYDELTNLCNESFFRDRLTQEIERGERYGPELSLLLLEITNFDELTEKYDPEYTEEILRKLGRKLSNSFRRIDVVARLSDEKFAILFPNTTLEDAKTAGERLLTLIENPFVTIQDEEINIEVSAGISNYPNDGYEPEELIKQTDIALYEAKQMDERDLQTTGEIEEK